MPIWVCTDIDRLYLPGKSLLQTSVICDISFVWMSEIITVCFLAMSTGLPPVFFVNEQSTGVRLDELATKSHFI